MTEQECQGERAADMQPEAAAGKAEAGFIAADARCCTQALHHDSGKRLQGLGGAPPTGADPAFADPMSGQGADDVAGPRQWYEVLDMQKYGQGCEPRAILGRLLGARWRRGPLRCLTMRTGFLGTTMLGDK